MDKKLIQELGKIITKKRLDIFKSVLDNRTRYLTIAIEDIYQSHNASAVLRSCDCFGIQDVHITENKNKFMPNSEIDMGSSKWLSLNKFRGENSTIDTITHLRKNGYRIVATTPHTNDVNLEEFEKRVKKIIGEPTHSISNIKTWLYNGESLTLEYPHKTKNGYIHLMYTDA